MLWEQHKNCGLESGPHTTNVIAPLIPRSRDFNGEQAPPG
jgi:hypothetical protein